MGEICQQPYMKKILENLGWDQGTRIPLASPENQDLENLLIDRQNEIQKLKEELICQQQKHKDLDKYKLSVLTESQENTRILFAQKQQLEQEVKLKQLASIEADVINRDIQSCQKNSKEFATHLETISANIAKLLKRADELKNEVCAEKGALAEWRALIERGAGDIAAIEQFTKQDHSKAKNLEVQRQKVKLEHDRLQGMLTQLVGQIAAEEMACERVSKQVKEGIRERQCSMAMWQSAVENLHQRDKEIRHMREDYLVLEEELKRIVEMCREQQNFYEQQRRNNLEAERENKELTERKGRIRLAIQDTAANNVHYENELQSLQREMSNLNNCVDDLRAQNRYILESQRRLDQQLSNHNQKVKDLKLRVVESQDNSKSAEKRAKQLEEMLNEEERFASQLTTAQQRAMHCSFLEQQKLVALKNEDKLYHMNKKESARILSKLDTRQAELEKKLLFQKETLYTMCFQVETLGAKVLHMEGGLGDRESNAEKAKKEARLKEVMAIHSARLSLLERHSTKLEDDMRRLVHELENKKAVHDKQASTLKTALLTMTTGSKALKESKETWRKLRVEESLVKLRVAHAARAVAGIEDAAFTLDKQRLQMDAALNERLAEIAVRRDLFMSQKRALREDCSRLRLEIKEREIRIQQLIKRYEIFITSLGKNDSGGEVSVSFFKVKYAAERAELREKGAALDAEIGRRERDLSALEATMRVVACAHTHFAHTVNPLSEQSLEMEEVRQLTDKYYELRDELKVVRADVSDLEIRVSDLSEQLTMLKDKNKQLIAREANAEAEVEALKERVAKQEAQLQNARDVVRAQLKRAKKLVDNVDEWRIFQLALWIRDLQEASNNAIRVLSEVCVAPSELRSRFLSLLTTTDLLQLVGPRDRQLHKFIKQITEELAPTAKHLHGTSVVDSIFSSSAESSRSGTSQASAFTKRFTQFRKTLAQRVQESTMTDFARDQGRRSSLSMRVVTLGLTDSFSTTPVTMSSRRNIN